MGVRGGGAGRGSGEGGAVRGEGRSVRGLHLLPLGVLSGRPPLDGRRRRRLGRWALVLPELGGTFGGGRAEDERLEVRPPFDFYSLTTLKKPATGALQSKWSATPSAGRLLCPRSRPGRRAGAACGLQRQHAASAPRLASTRRSSAMIQSSHAASAATSPTACRRRHHHHRHRHRRVHRSRLVGAACGLHRQHAAPAPLLASTRRSSATNPPPPAVGVGISHTAR